MRFSDWSSDVCSSDLLEADGDLVRDLATRPHRDAEIELKEPPDPGDELYEGVLFEPEILTTCIERRLVEEAARAGEAKFANVARDQATQEENKYRRPEQGREHRPQAFDNVYVHTDREEH